MLLGKREDLVLCFKGEPCLDVVRELGEKRREKGGALFHVRSNVTQLKNSEIFCIWAQSHRCRLGQIAKPISYVCSYMLIYFRAFISIKIPLFHKWSIIYCTNL